MKFNVLKFTVYIKILKSSDHELGDHKSSKNKIYRNFFLFQRFSHISQIYEDLRYEILSLRTGIKKGQLMGFHHAVAGRNEEGGV